MRLSVFALVFLTWASSAVAQTVTHRGFIDGRGFIFPDKAPTDTTILFGDLLVREELSLRPAGWFGFSAGLDLRANSDQHVEDEWRLDIEDRGLRRPRASLRRLAVTVNAGRLSVDVGKQFISWGRSDIVHPTDRFGPRDYLNVIEPELLPVSGVRTSLQLGSENVEAVWLPQMTPSRLPLLDRRWTFARVPAPAAPVDKGIHLPDESQYGLRWRHTGSRLELAVAAFQGFNHLPDIKTTLFPGRSAIGEDAESEAASLPALSVTTPSMELTRVFPHIQMLGGDIAIPTRWFILKGEAAYITSRDEDTDEYGLYVFEIERQTEEWLFDIGYAGETVQHRRVPFAFVPDRHLARSVIGRVQYTIEDITFAVDGAARIGDNGLYTKLEYSQPFAQRWRITAALVGLRGDPSTFLGQYRLNSYGTLALRFSY